MSTRSNIIINFVAFQIGWFSCVLMAARGEPLVGIVVALAVLFLHLWLVEKPLLVLMFMLFVMLLGSTWDSVLTSYQVFVFESGMIHDDMAPSWIIMMWLLFATTLTVSFRWLYGRYWLAMVLGIVFGPLTYQAGAALGAVVIPDAMRANLLIAMGWAILMPVLIKLAETFENTIYRPVELTSGINS